MAIHVRDAGRDQEIQREGDEQDGDQPLQQARVELLNGHSPEGGPGEGGGHGERRCPQIHRPPEGEVEARRPAAEHRLGLVRGEGLDRPQPGP